MLTIVGIHYASFLSPGTKRNQPWVPKMNVDMQGRNFGIFEILIFWQAKLNKKKSQLETQLKTLAKREGNEEYFTNRHKH